MAVKKAVTVVAVNGQTVNVNQLREQIRDARGPVMQSLAQAISGNHGFDSQDAATEFLMREWLMHTANIRRLDWTVKALEKMQQMYKPHG